MKTPKITLSLFLILILFSNKVISQERSGKATLMDKFSVGLNFGSLLTYGDIKEYNFYPASGERKWGFGGIVNFQISPLISFQAQGLMGKLAGIKREFISGTTANLKFDADIYEGSLNATLSLNRLLAPNLKLNEKVNFYVLAGVGLLKFRTQLRGLHDDYFIKDYGYSIDGTVKEKMTTETSFPIGLGIKFKASRKIDIVLESSLRNVITDKLDAFVRPSDTHDKYGYTFIGVSYKFGKQENVMKWKSSNNLEGTPDKLALDEANKKMDDMSKKLDELTQKVNNLENKTPIATTNVSEGGNIDAQKLAELNQKLADLDNKNKELGGRIINMQTSNVTYEGGKPILVSIFFEINKSTIVGINNERVAAATKYLLNNPSAKLELIGYADKRGGQRYNELLSERRAGAVKESLVNEYGIDASRISTSFKGFSEPLSKQNYDINRRVDFMIK